jgi:hypothetical protein
MNYTTKLTSEQTIRIDDETVIKINPAGGTLSNDAVRAISTTKWGKRLIDTGYLTFDGRSDEPDSKKKAAKKSETIPTFEEQ